MQDPRLRLDPAADDLGKSGVKPVEAFSTAELCTTLAAWAPVTSLVESAVVWPVVILLTTTSKHVWTV